MANTSVGDKTITAYLKRIIGPPVGQIISLTNSDISIGRTKKSDICINDPNISRSHCTLNYSTDGWFITDLGGVNGTYLDNEKLMPQIPHPLKDGFGIYLGPPSDSPVAFVFMKNKVEETPKKEEKNLQSEKKSLNDDHANQSLSTQLNLKRRSDTNSDASPSKKHAPSTSSHHPVRVQNDTDGKDSDISDISICSLDSLRTRIRKMNSHKKKKRSSDSCNNIASASASPSLRISTPKFDCIPSTSSGKHVHTLKIRLGSDVKSHYKKITPGALKELESLFSDSDSLTETADKGEDSESLLIDGIIFTNAGPNLFAQSVKNGLPGSSKQTGEAVASEKSLQKKKKLKNLNEQLQKTHVKLLKENSEQKKKLMKLTEASTSKKESPEHLGDMLEEELICNICTEVFIKATTLGCSHTFCEHCITEWKKKQKRCPMCREMITSQTRILIMDNFIDKVVGKLDKVYQDKRKEVIASREAAKANAKVKKTKRRITYRSRAARRPANIPTRVRSNNHDELRQWRLNLLNEAPFRAGDSIQRHEMSSGSD